MATTLSRILSSNSLGATAVLIQTGQTFISGVKVINATASTAYVQLFDAAAAADVTVGTTTPTWVVRSAASDPSADADIPPHGLIFVNGVVAASTTTATGSSAATQHLRVMVC